MSTEELDRAARASRGKRMSKLLEEEEEADDEFWNQEAFKDEAEDNEYATEDEEADVFDSDFDEAEDADDEEFAEEDERRPSKKRKLPPGHQNEKRKKKQEKKERKEKKEKEKKEKREKKEKSKNALSLERRDSFPFSEQAPEDTSLSLRTPPAAQRTTQIQENGETPLDIDGERSVRKSTRTAVVIKQAEREAHQAALQALSRPVKKKKEEERKISQEEMLLEAAQTEIQNVQALEVMLAREEEVKRKATIQKTIYAGPQIRFHSRDGKNILGFTKVSDFPEILNSPPTPYPRKVFCVITGLPAKYRDPKTGLPYATKEAFKAIRDKFNKRENPRGKNPLEESHQRKRTKVERERSGIGGRRTVTQMKYKNVISMIVGHNDTAVTVAVEPTEPEEVPNPEQVMEQQVMEQPPQQTELEEDSVDLNFASGLMANKNDDIESLQISRNLMTHDLSLLDMPEAFVETNEADFMLDDLEVAQSSAVE